MNAPFIMKTKFRSFKGCEQKTNDERLAEWAYVYYSQGHHKTPRKPRVKVVTNS